jgi:uncharacterized membrane protein
VSGPIPHAFVAYPLIPWLAVMSLCYCIGALFELGPQQRVQRFMWLGAAALVAFVLLRAPNALVVATLYPACRWFAAVKRRRSDWWLSYL